MQLIAPEILEQARGLSLHLSAAGLVVGLLVWLTGWSGHRFWIVLSATVVAGLIGLSRSQAFGVQPVVAALLLAVAAGVLALALVRVVAFVAGGIAAWTAVQALAPAPWQEPLVCFLAGGLVGLFLFRFWTMVLTSFVGTLLMGYFGLLAADSLGRVDALNLTNQQGPLLNWICAGVTLAGVLLQYLIQRWRGKKKSKRDKPEDQLYPPHMRPEYQAKKQKWWKRGNRPYRQAG
jgi:MFS family permease